MKPVGQDSQDDIPVSNAGPDEFERSRLALELGRLRLERQKASIEVLLKRREMKVAKTKRWREIFANP